MTLGGISPGRPALGDPSLITTLALTLGKVALFIALMLVVGRRLFPKLLWQVARTGSRELFTFCVIATAVGIAYGSAALFGVSFALGAFFAGMMMRESPLSHRAAEESLPFRDSFSVLFFVSVGMLFDPQVLVREPMHVTRGRGHYHFRQIAGGIYPRLAFPLSVEYRAHRIREPCPDRRILFHPGWIGTFAWAFAGGRSESYPRWSNYFNRI